MIPDSKKIPIIEQIGQGKYIHQPLFHMHFNVIMIKFLANHLVLTWSQYFYSADYALNDGADEELQMMAVCSVMFRQFQ